ncbi:MAG: hypothetical protein CBB97_25895 [Candidatus Endolissoclinum sp. TMED37]|nr:MAG: hypothetical protein CBB97_25895 [Candidatus Endolissoclinum sp. TMED37]
MIFFIAPSGGNNSYLCMKLINKDTGSTTTYHGAGSHSNKNEIINYMHIDRVDQDTKVVITQDYDNIKNLVRSKDTVIQNYINKDREMLLINWFHKNIQRLGDEPELKFGWRDSWIEWQTDLWKHNSKIPIASAVAEWMFKLFDDNFSDIRRVPAIEKVFNWSVMYESSQATVDEFNKIGYNYTIEEHDKWLQSQTEILGHWAKIKNSIEDPLSLNDDIHKGIALALHGRKYDLLRQQVETKFNLLP